MVRLLKYSLLGSLFISMNVINAASYEQPSYAAHDDFSDSEELEATLILAQFKSDLTNSTGIYPRIAKRMERSFCENETKPKIKRQRRRNTDDPYLLLLRQWDSLPHTLRDMNFEDSKQVLSDFWNSIPKGILKKNGLLIQRLRIKTANLHFDEFLQLSKDKQYGKKNKFTSEANEIYQKGMSYFQLINKTGLIEEMYKGHTLSSGAYCYNRLNELKVECESRHTGT